MNITFDNGTEYEYKGECCTENMIRIDPNGNIRALTNVTTQERFIIAFLTRGLCNGKRAWFSRENAPVFTNLNSVKKIYFSGFEKKFPLDESVQTKLVEEQNRSKIF